MDQTTLNFILGGFSCLMGFMLKVIWDSVKDLQKGDVDLAARVGEIEVLVAGKYVTTERLDQMMKGWFARLDQDRITVLGAIDKIDAKLDKKADK